MSKRGVVMLMGVLALSGCAEMRKDKACKWGLPAWGAAMGGVGAGLGVSQGDGDASDGEIAGAAAGGTIVGGLAGWLLGHYICEEEAPPPPAPPPPPPPPPARHKIETLVGPNFDFDKATLRPGGKEKLDHVVKVMTDNPSMRVTCEGHTDSIGKPAYNLKLSERRANAARDYLIEKGISPSRIAAKGFGETQPIADNKTEEGRAQNRRVEVIAE